jgi:hypothetical protein
MRAAHTLDPPAAAVSAPASAAEGNRVLDARALPEGGRGQRPRTGDGIVGRFKVRVLPRCRGASMLVVSIGRAGPVSVVPAVPVRGTLPVCAGAGAGVASGLPPSFPLPSGTVIRSSHKHTDRSRPFDFVSAVAPGTIDRAATFILHRLPRAGYRLVQADRETYEAEAAFAGHGIKGRVRFHSLLACAGVLTIDIATWRP